MNRRGRLHLVLACALTVVVCGSARGEAPTASLESLVISAQFYGSTPDKLARREAAKEALVARGDESLRFLLDHVHLTNDSVRILIQELVRTRLPAETVTPVLMEFLGAERVDARRVAAYYLGHLPPAPDAETPLLAMLQDDRTAGAAARTLGKWSCTAAVERVIQLLDSDKEVRRIVAVNALRDIGDPRAIAPLIARLDDPVFTVRKVAARALIALGPQAESALLAAAPASRPPARRELVRVLGALQSPRATAYLLNCLEDPDPYLRADAQRALDAEPVPWLMAPVGR